MFGTITCQKFAQFRRLFLRAYHEFQWGCTVHTFEDQISTGFASKMGFGACLFARDILWRSLIKARNVEEDASVKDSYHALWVVHK